ncbi:hypothetical protein A0H81_05026 [Grifola frondosa]|uniref:BTB domain-containing protein n=1 Tax=Grifola frondosa TaxID=5627 RepID=A0A1C7MJ84_GRIFR|nr:hypothetical protein A0H81_05026 [Grifola frondosa]
MAPSDTTESLLTHVRDDTFYSNDVIFLVENVLFKVPRNVFEESEIFRTMFSLPVPDGGVADGSSDEHPLHLEGIACDDFRPFLRVLVPLSYHTRRITLSKESIQIDRHGDPLRAVVMSFIYAHSHSHIMLIEICRRNVTDVEHYPYSSYAVYSYGLYEFVRRHNHATLGYLRFTKPPDPADRTNMRRRFRRQIA